MSEENGGLAFSPDRRLVALFNSDYKLFSNILLFRVRPMLSQTVLPTQVEFVPKQMIQTALTILMLYVMQRVRTPIYIKLSFCFSISLKHITRYSVLLCCRC